MSRSRLRGALALPLLLVLCISCSGGGGGGSGGTTSLSDETSSQPATTTQVTLAWNASASPGVRGYKLYCGTESGNYPYVNNVGDTVVATVSNLVVGIRYYCAATAYTSDAESGFSNEVSFTAGG